MKKLILLSLFAIVFGVSDILADIKFIPVEHASMAIKYNNLTILIDPVGNIDQYVSIDKPDLVLITHTHGDHLKPELLDKLVNENTTVIGPKAVTDDLGYGTTLVNGDKTTFKKIIIEAIAMYNTTEERLKFHPKGKGNGYVLTLGDERVYISGDTEDIPEIRALENIDYAFICMNLPYTMTAEQAASAVIQFQPKKVYPYHYRQRDGFADINKFKTLVNNGCYSEVVFLDWYPKAN